MKQFLCGFSCVNIYKPFALLR